VKRWWLVILLLLSLGTNIGILATQVVGRMDKPNQPEVVRPFAFGRLQILADRLGLRGEERRSFIERQRRFLRDTAGPRKHLNEIRAELRSELTAPRPDRAHVDALMKEASDLFLRLEQRLSGLVLETRSTLPPQAALRYVDLLGRLKIEGPGGYGRLPPAWWRWFRTGGDAPDMPSDDAPGKKTSEGEGPSPNQ
jgi:hypothetical protein